MTESSHAASYPPPTQFVEQANAGEELYHEAENDRLAFWAKQANRLSWATPFTEVLDWSDAPFAKWFVGGKLNVAYNCVDRHVEAGNGDRVAIHWEGEPVGDSRSLTYSDLQAEVCKAANALTEPGSGRRRPGRHLHADDPRGRDRDAGLRAAGPDAQRGVRRFHRHGTAARIADAQAKLLITADGQFRRGKPAPLKDAADEAVAAARQSDRARSGGAAHRN